MPVVWWVTELQRRPQALPPTPSPFAKRTRTRTRRSSSSSPIWIGLKLTWYQLPAIKFDASTLRFVGERWTPNLDVNKGKQSWSYLIKVLILIFFFLNQEFSMHNLKVPSTNPLLFFIGVHAYCFILNQSHLGIKPLLRLFLASL